MLRYQLHAHAVHAHEGLGRLQERRFGHGTAGGGGWGPERQGRQRVLGHESVRSDDSWD